MDLVFEQQLALADARKAQEDARRALESFMRVLQQVRDNDAKRHAELRAAVNDTLAECARLVEQVS
jgi:hypothetical protein